MIKNNSFFKRNLAFVLAPIFSRITTFLVLPIYTDKLSTAFYGRLELIITIGVFFKTLVSLSTTTIFWKFTSKKDSHGYGKVVFNIIVMPIGMSLFIYIISRFFLTYIDYYNLIFLFCISELIMVINNVGVLITRDKYKGKIFFILNLVYIFVFVFCTYFFLVKYDFGILGVVYSYILAAFVNFILIFILVIKNNIVYKLDFVLIKKMFLYSYPLVLSNLSFLALSFSDRFLISGLLNKTELGKYSYIRRIGTITKVAVVDTFFTVWNPLRWKIYNHTKGLEIFTNVIMLFRALTLYSYIPIYFTLIILAELLTNNTELKTSLKLLLFIIQGHLYFGMYYLNISGLLFKDKTKIISLIVLTTAILNVFFNFLFIEQYGILVPCITFTFSFILMVIISNFLSKKYYKTQISQANEILYVINVAIQFTLSYIYIAKIIDLFIFIMSFILVLIFNCFLYFRSKQKINFKILKNVLKIH